ncbi:MAG: MFS transporter [Armatimonadota bacterium]
MQPTETTTERAGVPFRRRAVYAVLIVILMALTNYRSILPIFRDQLQDYLHIHDKLFGVMFSLPQWLSLVPLLLVGWIVARWGPRRLLTLSLLVTGAGMAYLALCGANWVWLSLALILSTMGAVLLDVSGSTFLVQLYPEQKRRILSLGMAARSGTEMMTPLLAEGLMLLAVTAPAVSFAAVLHLPFVLLTVAFVAGAVVLRAPGSPPNGQARWRWRDLLISRRSAGLLVLIMLHGAADATLFTWMSRFLGSDAFSEQPFRPGFVLSAFSVAYIVSRLLLARLPEGWGRRALLVLPGLLGGSIFILAILSRDYLLTAAGYVIGAFCWSLEYPTMLGRIAEQEGERFGAAMALISVASAVGFASTMLLSGWFIQSMGEPRMWIPMAVFASGFVLAGLGGALWLKLTEGKGE